jgi:hypothetical protein
MRTSNLLLVFRRDWSLSMILISPVFLHDKLLSKFHLLAVAGIDRGVQGLCFVLPYTFELF